METVIVRYGELGLKKGGTRKKFERALLKHISSVLKGKGTLTKEYGRIFIETRNASRVAQSLAKIPGIVSTSPTKIVEFSDLNDLARKAGAHFKVKRGHTFAIRPRRAGVHTFTSQDVGKEIGTVVVNKGGKVNLDNPRHEFFVEVRNSRAYLFTKVYEGPAGLPFGVEGKVVALLSGPNSAAATWLMMKRGCAPILLHAGNKSEVLKHMRLLRQWSPVPLKLHLTSKASGLDLLKFGETLAEREKALAIVTGERLGEVRSLSEAKKIVRMPVYRPLLLVNKEFVKGLQTLTGIKIGKGKTLKPTFTGTELRSTKVVRV